MGLGMNTKSTSTKPHASLETAEAWIQDWLRQTIEAADVPEKFFLMGWSWGGYASMMTASIMPERIEGLFLNSPAGSQVYHEETYDKYMNMDQGGRPGMIYKKEDCEFFVDAFENNKHPLWEKINQAPKCLHHTVFGLIASDIPRAFK